MIDLYIPVLGRPANVAPLIESIRENTRSEHAIYFICSKNDLPQIAEVRGCGLEPLIAPWSAGRADFAKKINWAFDQTDSEWFFQGADDIRFCKGWDVFCLAIARQKRAGVIGTNDLHNPGVLRGEHSTHTLIRRSYIEQHGGTFDDTGKVFHEGYDHQYVDNEFIALAKMRGQFAFAEKAIVEHFHPHWGNARRDTTYQKAMRRTMADRRLFRERLSLMTGGRLPRRARYSSRR